MNHTIALTAYFFCALSMASLKFDAAWAADPGDPPKAAAGDNSTPSVSGNSAGDLAALFDKLDANYDGQITSDEVPEEHRRLFDRLLRRADKNGDGKLSRDEFMAGMKEDRPRRAADASERPVNRPNDGGAAAGSKPQDDKMAADAPKNGASDGRPGAAAGGPPEGKGRAGFGGGFGGGGLAGGGPGPFMGIAIFRALDTNGDGKLDAKEIAAAGDVLKKLANDSGDITREQLLNSLPPGITPPGGAGQAGGPGPAGGRGLAGRVGGSGRGAGGGMRGILQLVATGSSAPDEVVARLMQSLDQNHDGKLQKDELPPMLQNRFDELDKNHDGVLDDTELKALVPDLLRRIQNLQERGPEGGPNGSERPPRRPSSADKPASESPAESNSAPAK